MTSYTLTLTLDNHTVETHLTEADLRLTRREILDRFLIPAFAVLMETYRRNHPPPEAA